MLDRIMVAVCLLGGVALAVFLFQDRYAAQACDANDVSSALIGQIKGKVGANGLYLLNAQQTAGWYLSRVRQCEVDAAPIVDSVVLGHDRWVKVLYTVGLDRKTGAATVASTINGKVQPDFVQNE
jgi:hypothetical protein